MGRVKKSVAVSEVPGEGRARALEAVMAQIDKNYGAGAVMRMGDRKHRVGCGFGYWWCAEGSCG